jgi:hypothetical protein
VQRWRFHAFKRWRTARLLLARPPHGSARWRVEVVHGLALRLAVHDGSWSRPPPSSARRRPASPSSWRRTAARGGGTRRWRMEAAVGGAWRRLASGWPASWVPIAGVAMAVGTTSSPTSPTTSAHDTGKVPVDAEEAVICGEEVGVDPCLNSDSLNHDAGRLVMRNDRCFCLCYELPP